MESVIAVPIRPRPFVFLIVRNPKQHLDRPNLLQLLGVVILQQINTMAIDSGRSMTFSPEDIQDSKDVLIHLFGNLEIYTSHGVLTEEKINSRLITMLVGYLLTDKMKYHRSIDLARIVYPNTVAEKDNPSKNVKALIHRLNELFSSISDDRLIPPNVNGYTLNRELHIITDLEQFEIYWKQAQKEVSIIRKVEYLKKAAAFAYSRSDRFLFVCTDILHCRSPPSVRFRKNEIKSENMRIKIKFWNNGQSLDIMQNRFTAYAERALSRNRMRFYTNYMTRQEHAVYMEEGEEMYGSFIPEDELVCYKKSLYIP